LLALDLVHYLPTTGNFPNLIAIEADYCINLISLGQFPKLVRLRCRSCPNLVKFPYYPLLKSSKTAGLGVNFENVWTYQYLTYGFVNADRSGPIGDFHLRKKIYSYLG
jgi:hypothetical protein